MNFLRKALAVGLTPANVISWLSLKTLIAAETFFGSPRLRVKAFLLGVRLGRRVAARGPVCLMRWPGGEITIGDGVSIVSAWRGATAAVCGPTRLRVFGPGAKIEIGDGCQLTGASITARSRLIKLGRKVLLGPNCVIVDSDFHSPWPAESRAENPGYENDAPVVVGDYAWIGMNSIILKGVTVGEGAIVGAGSVVTRDAPPRCVVCGSPARVVRDADGRRPNEH